MSAAEGTSDVEEGGKQIPSIGSCNPARRFATGETEGDVGERSLLHVGNWRASTSYTWSVLSGKAMKRRLGFVGEKAKNWTESGKVGRRPWC